MNKIIAKAVDSVDRRRVVYLALIFLAAIVTAKSIGAVERGSSRQFVVYLNLKDNKATAINLLMTARIYNCVVAPDVVRVEANPALMPAPNSSVIMPTNTLKGDFTETLAKAVSIYQLGASKFGGESIRLLDNGNTVALNLYAAEAKLPELADKIESLSSEITDLCSKSAVAE